MRVQDNLDIAVCIHSGGSGDDRVALMSKRIRGSASGMAVPLPVSPAALGEDKRGARNGGASRVSGNC